MSEIATTTNPHLAAVTPELRSWIVEQAQAGVSAPRVLQAMLDAGWCEEVALAAMEAVLSEHLQGTAAAAVQPQARSEDMPPAVPVPDLTLQQHPAFLDAGDRQVRVVMSLQQPRVVVLDGVLDAQECQQLIELAQPRMKRSMTVDNHSGGDELNADRTSEGMFFERGEHPVVAALEARIARLLDWPLENGEGLQVLRYGPGAEYKPHYDYFELGQPSTATLLRRGGQRVGTFLVYLNTPPEGGGTTFPNAGLEVTAQQGMAVFFSYDKPHPSTLSLHGGAPVISGEKWVATKWLREREFH
ncbi:2-oxoglutarate-dependent dioxygenase [Vandammella animalimorsus]|uniref:2-oxoglutarate-dependent dioxygenase n=1 Tax=Vandammella animalimorsus TaxID=2029117 RepID=A0A3M6RL74_9BURK|nr:2OG-Fe(II) oxygenase [Vandammella animalimorsus]RMX15202.1 2-oxoglutarate-dependent dioxygenase [Vandammella animalimorsus]